MTAGDRTKDDQTKRGTQDDAPEPTEDAQGGADVVVVDIEDSIDLHGFAPRDIPDVVVDYLEAAHDKGFREVRLIHGRGKGVQRARVQALLERHPLVLRYTNAAHWRGGWGATVVVLADEPRE